MISQPNLSVTAQFRDFVHPPLKAVLSNELETYSLDRQLGTGHYLLGRFHLRCITALRISAFVPCNCTHKKPLKKPG